MECSLECSLEMLNPCASSASIEHPEISAAQFCQSQNVLWNVLLAGSVRLADPFWNVLGIFFWNILLEPSFGRFSAVG